jgi:hypothetical protein
MGAADSGEAKLRFADEAEACHLLAGDYPDIAAQRNIGGLTPSGNHHLAGDSLLSETPIYAIL